MVVKGVLSALLSAPLKFVRTLRHRRRLRKGRRTLERLRTINAKREGILVLDDRATKEGCDDPPS